MGPKTTKTGKTTPQTVVLHCLRIFRSISYNTVLGSKNGSIMNTITVAEIKRSGFTALDAALQFGPVQLMKRNRPGAVVLRPDDYERMLRLVARGQADAGNRALALLTNETNTNGKGLDAAAMQTRLAELGDVWGNR